MKPSWEDAPEWARYLVGDAYGGQYWCEDEPEPSRVVGYWLRNKGYRKYAGGYGENGLCWKEERPK